MTDTSKDFHVLDTALGPVVFHAPSYRLFQVDEETAERVGAAGSMTGEEAESLQKTLIGKIDGQAFRLKTSLLGDHAQLNGFYLFVSQECNLACTYCYGDGGEYRKSKMNMDETTARNFVDKFLTGESPTYVVNFFGGEPFLNFSLMQKVVAYAKEKGKERGFKVSFKVTTNGTVWSERIKKFVDEEIDNLTVSLDGPKDINDAQRPPLGHFSSYQKTLNTINELKAIKDKRYTIRTILTKKSCEKLDEVYRHNSALVAPGGVGMTIADVDENNPLALSDADYRTVYDSVIRRNSESLRSLAQSDAPSFNEYTYQLCELLLFRKYRPNPCNAGRTVIAVAADGDIYPCHRFVGYNEFRVGNVNDDPPLHADYFNVTQSFKDTSVDANEHCSRCWARYLCGGNCYVISWLREGDVFKPPARECHSRRRVYDRLLAEFAEIMADPEEKARFMANVTAFYQQSRASA